MMQYIMYSGRGIFHFSQKSIVLYIFCAGENTISLLNLFYPTLSHFHIVNTYLNTSLAILSSYFRIDFSFQGNAIDIVPVHS